MFRQNGQQKHATLFQNELKNDVAGFTTLIQTCEPFKSQWWPSSIFSQQYPYIVNR